MYMYVIAEDHRGSLLQGTLMVSNSHCSRLYVHLNKTMEKYSIC